MFSDVFFRFRKENIYSYNIYPYLRSKHFQCLFAAPACPCRPSQTTPIQARACQGRLNPPPYKSKPC
jgi:hypothetical protein